MKSFLRIILPLAIVLILLASVAYMVTYMKQVDARDHILDMERGLDEIFQIQLTESRFSSEAFHYASTGRQPHLLAFQEQKKILTDHLDKLSTSDLQEKMSTETESVVNSTRRWIVQIDSLVQTPISEDTLAVRQYLRSPVFMELRDSVYGKLSLLEKLVVGGREGRMKELGNLTRINMVGFVALIVIAVLMLILATRVNAARLKQLYQFQLQQKDREFEVAFQHAPIGKVIVDRQGNCTRVNKRLCELLGYDEAGLTKKRFADLCTPGEYKEDLKVIAMLIQGNLKTHEREKEFITSSGKTIWVQQSMSFVSHEDGSPQQLIVQLKDITAEKENLRLLQESNIELEQFAYTASHDLKEPLRMIDGFMKLLDKNYSHLLDENGKKYIHFATDGAKRMNNLLEDLLHYSRVTRVASEPELVNMNEMMIDIKKSYEPIMEQTGAKITWGPLPNVSVPATALRIVLQNLVSNAIKYQKEDSLPEITIRSSEKGRNWQIAVTDNGIGIRPEFFDKIFVIFKRLHGKTEYEGSGIGLATSKRLVEKWGGRISVASEEGKGSTFYFTIPKVNG